jgi:hypothetical protein
VTFESLEDNSHPHKDIIIYSLKFWIKNNATYQLTQTVQDCLSFPGSGSSLVFMGKTMVALQNKWEV